MQCDPPPGPAIRAYTRRLFISMTIYAAVLIAVIKLFQQPHPPTGLVAMLLATFPAFPIIGVFWAIARLIVETTDEYQRLLFVKQILIATALTLSIATVWGFLENFGQVPHAEAFYVSILWFAMLGVGALVARWRA